MPDKKDSLKKVVDYKVTPLTKEEDALWLSNVSHPLREWYVCYARLEVFGKTKYQTKKVRPEDEEEGDVIA